MTTLINKTRWPLLFCIFASLSFAQAKLPEIDALKVKAKLGEILSAHATYKELNPELVERALSNYLEELDPTKTYLIQSDIDRFLNPCETLTRQILNDYSCENFCVFEQMHQKMVQGIERRKTLEASLSEDALPKSVDPKEFKDLEWAQSENELKERLLKLKAIQLDVAKKLSDEPVEKTIQRIEKRRRKHEDRLLSTKPGEKKKLILSNVLKSFARAFDAHTAYFTPDEAEQFMINVQQRLFGIGVQFRDDITGFTVIKILEGGPSLKGGLLKAKDRIIAVDGEPVVGMDIIEAAELIRGPKGTKVVLKVVRLDEEAKEKILDITIIRDEVVLTETRYESAIEPFGDGAIAYLRLFSFYQDPTHSSAKDLTAEFTRLKRENHILGVILDLRNNTGGMLSQAVDVAGLFITRGPVVSIKDETNKIQHLRDFDGETIWNGPLVILINSVSASASEIVAQTLQDYGRAIVVGDEHSYGKGSFQTFTLNSNGKRKINPSGEYKVTRGRYYTVSGKSPQLHGISSNIVVPGGLSETEIGEKHLKFPLSTDSIDPLFDDQLLDVQSPQREQILPLYLLNRQEKMTIYEPFLPILTTNSEKRIENNVNYQNFLKELKEKDDQIEEDPENSFGKNDLQLVEAYSIMKDLVMMILTRSQMEKLEAVSLTR